jgi:hypothetical protein
VTEQKNALATVALFLFVLGDAALRISDPGAVDLAGFAAFMALLTSLAILFTTALELPRLPAAIALALFGLHPVTIDALKSRPDWNLVACLTGIAAGIAIFRWKPGFAMLPAVGCVLLHRAGLAFGLLLVAFALIFARERIVWALTGLAVSIAALLLHREPFRLVNDLSLAGWVAIAALVLASLWLRQRTAWFGLIWFAVMTLVAPTEPIAGAPGLAVAVVAVVTDLFMTKRFTRAEAAAEC